MGSTKTCPYCGGDAMAGTVELEGWPEGGSSRVSLCDDCGRFEWV